MVKVEVIESFNLERFNELKNIKRKATDTKGKLYVGDIFECTEEMAEYLTGNNVLNKEVVKIIEVKPETKVETKVEQIEEKTKKPSKKHFKK